MIYEICTQVKQTNNLCASAATINRILYVEVTLVSVIYTRTQNLKSPNGLLSQCFAIEAKTCAVLWEVSFSYFINYKMLFKFIMNLQPTNILFWPFNC